MWTRRSAHRIRRSPHRRRRTAAPTPGADDRPLRAVGQRLRQAKHRRRRDDCRHRRVRRRQSRRQRHRASSFRGRGNLLSGRVLICGHAENHRPHTERRATVCLPPRFHCCFRCPHVGGVSPPTADGRAHGAHVGGRHVVSPGYRVESAGESSTAAEREPAPRRDSRRVRDTASGSKSRGDPVRPIR